MKSVTVRTKFDEVTKYIAIETVDDVNDYAETLQHNVDNAVTRLITSKVPIERWDHMITRDDQGSVLAAAVTTAWVRGTNPLYELGPMFSSKIQSFLEYIALGRTILVNDNGGYCYFDPDYHTIIEEIDYTTPDKYQYKVKAGTTYINLENDPNLEDNAINYLNKVDPKYYSWVTNLYNVSEDKLCEILIEFRANGGEVVYVYTTATNVPQMYDYCRCIIDSGIKKVEFEFSIKPNKDVKEVIRHLEDFNVEVEVL